MRKFLSVILFFVLTAPAIADECPMGYTPTKYTQLEYIESTGTQYIDTGYFITSSNYLNIKYETDTSLTSGASAQWQCDGIGYSNPCLYIAKSPDNKLAFGYGNPVDITTNRTLTQDEYTSIHKYVLDVPNGKGYFDNEEYSFTPVIGTGFDSNFYIFTWNSKNYSQQHFQSAKKKSAKLWDNGTLVRNFIPAKRNSDGEIGMYDTVTGHFFTNAGTGEFIAGPEILTNNTCFPCPPNTYKDFVGNGDCTPCPDTFSSPSGAKSINECGRILHIGDYVAHMPFGRRTEHGLCTMFDGKKYCADVYEKQ